MASLQRRDRSPINFSTENVSDLADRAVMNHELAVESGIASIRWQIQREAEIAKAREKRRISDFCEDCGEEIPQSRLKVLPGARKCRDCQETTEKSGSRVRVGF